jgi:hypothetical protein
MYALSSDFATLPVADAFMPDRAQVYRWPMEDKPNRPTKTPPRRSSEEPKVQVAASSSPRNVPPKSGPIFAWKSLIASRIADQPL